MDALYKRYARPLEVLDIAAETGRLRAFVRSLFVESQEDRLFDMWLHKSFDKTWKDFRETAMRSASNRHVSKSRIVASIKESKAILDAFQPVKGVK